MTILRAALRGCCSVLALAVVAGSCSRDRSAVGTDSQTHWLKRCDTDAECGSLRCLCGVCSQTCAVANDCAALASNASCGLLSGCTGAAASACGLECARDGDCSSSVPGATCVSGQCHRLSPTSTRADASLDSGLGAAGNGSGNTGTGGATPGTGGATPGADGATLGAGGATLGAGGATPGAAGGGSAGGLRDAGRGGSAFGAGGSGGTPLSEGGVGGLAGWQDVPDGPAGPCGAPLSGTAPFGATLSGVATFAEDAGVSPQAVSVGVFFPQGRAEGAPVVVSRPSLLPTGGLTYGRATLDATLSASVSLFDGCRNGISGVVTGPAGGLLAKIDLNPDPNYGDLIRLASSQAWLCPSGAVPAPTATLQGTTIPTGTIHLDVSTPIDETTLGAIRVQGLDAVEASWEFLYWINVPWGLVAVKPASGRAFPFGTVAIDVSGLRDVMGRPYQTQGELSVSIGQPTQAIVDTSMTSVPSGAVVANRTPTLADGALSFSPGTGTQAVLGLGPAASATKLRTVHRAVCSYPSASPSDETTTLVSSDGFATPITLACADAPEEVTTTLVGQGPFYLVVSATGVSTPCNPPAAPPGYELDEFSFLP